MAFTVGSYLSIAYMDVGKERELGAEALRGENPNLSE